MGNVAKRHHFVPNFYLKGFAQVRDGEKYGQITVLTIKDQSSKTISTRDTALRSDFYSLTESFTESPDAFERAMNENVETPATPVLRSIREGGQWPLGSQDRSTLASFMALQWLRGPDYRQAVQTGIDSFERLLDHVQSADGLRRWSEHAGDPLAADESRRLWEHLRAWEPLTIGSEYHVSLINQSHSETTQRILNRPWRMIHFPQPTLFTSDAPLSPLPGRDINQGVFTLRSAPHFFPVGRSIGIVLGAESHPAITPSVRNGERDKCTTGTAKQSTLVGSAVVSGVIDRLFHHPEDAPLIPAPFEGIRRARRRVNVTPGMLRDTLHQTEHQRRERKPKTS